MSEEAAREKIEAWAQAAFMAAALLFGLVSMGSVGALFARVGPRTSVVMAEIALVTPFLLLAAAARISPARALAVRAVPHRTLLLSIACGAAFWVASAGLVETQSSLWPPPPEVFSFFEKLRGSFHPTSPLDRAASILAMAVIPALAEELVFRGALLSALARATSGPVALAVSAGIFGAIHYAPAGYRIPFALAVGLALGLLRLRTGSVIPGLVAHAVLNSITLTITPMIEDGAQPAAAAPLGPALGLLLLGTTLSAVFVWLCRPPVDPGTPRN